MCVVSASCLNVSVEGNMRLVTSDSVGGLKSTRSRTTEAGVQGRSPDGARTVPHKIASSSDWSARRIGENVIRMPCQDLRTRSSITVISIHTAAVQLQFPRCFSCAVAMPNLNHQDPLHSHPSTSVVYCLLRHTLHLSTKTVCGLST